MRKCPSRMSLFVFRCFRFFELEVYSHSFFYIEYLGQGCLPVLWFVKKTLLGSAQFLKYHKSKSELNLNECDRCFCAKCYYKHNRTISIEFRQHWKGCKMLSIPLFVSPNHNKKHFYFNNRFIWLSCFEESNKQ